ncbi:MAG: hypothetical protein A2805_00215 [Candidatus Andersenbacteria bacterium RIFCSPHIGHO2_01_FULL_46_36]|uniref:Glycosyltransferase subfamily 4-like N-terminal domain-containing protein n=1 Tax=Candidatus Andersenbacteria bacterium RIFCSPHIGHO2_12_FULL_45_11 TaxID=1797281 RepID=A0A1G1X2E2_9BACT|nr:MAG: hypothetical protein A2805_00215 [Candidatus Andersenbacteria bacterium RIFCSPHIGHO2_01_FULL_46_36]OGY34182.1 MAG: hypothetical protein A3D99_00490 [Candidatus Andersenbacteria bacterium RIFCSPHIGHO2_12_FULL_45_11]
MRIWILAENWPPRIGGIERYLTGIAGNLTGHDVTVIAPRLQRTPTPAASGDSPLSKGEKSATIIRKRFFHPMWPKWLPLYFFLSKKAKQEKPGLIIGGKALFEGRLALKLKEKYKIPYVICTYGMEIATWTASRRIRTQLIRVLQNADAVLYINKKTKEELLTLGVQEERLVLQYPGINVETLQISPNSKDVLQKYNIQAPYIISVGRLVARKGFDDLIEAYSHIKTPVQLVIVGDGPERANLERHAKTLGVTPTFTGSVSEEELHALYAHASVFALTPKELPGDYEGFGIVYCEAAYFGLPAIGTRTGGVAEAVENGVTGILALPNHPKSITEALAKLLNDPTLATQYGQAGKQRVLQKFQWKESIKMLEKVLENIVVRNSNP